MDDIKLPSEGDSDDDRLFIRSIDQEDENNAIHFQKTPVQDSSSESTTTPSSSPSISRDSAQNFVTISFAKFVQLVANHSYVDVVDRNADELVVLSGNLLTDLANAHDRTRERRMPLMFVGGLVLGVILTYILLK